MVEMSLHEVDLIGFQHSNSIYKESFSLRVFKDGSCASTYRLAVGDVGNTPRTNLRP